MPSKPVGLGLLVATCMAAAVGGAYLATRQNVPPAQSLAPPQASSSLDPASPVSGARTAVTPVQPDAQPAAQAAANASPDEPARPAAGPTPTRRRAQAASSREAAPDSPLQTEPPIARPDEARTDMGAAAQPRSSPDIGGLAPAPAAPQPPVPPPSVEGAPVSELQQTPPPAPTFNELVVPADAVLGLQLETSLSSERAQVEDRVDAKVTRDVRVGNRVAIPAGTRVIGSVVQVGRGGKVKERAYLSIRFHTVMLTDATRLTINTEAVSRESESPASKSAAKIGGAAVGGAVLGAIVGGGRGAAIGGTLGAAGGTTAVMAGGRATVVLPSGTLLTVRMLAPITVTVEK